MSDDATVPISPLCVILVFAVFFSLPGCSTETTDETLVSSGKSGPVWVVEPKDPGNNLPSVGRSLFDYLVTEQKNGKIVYDVPVPFAALAKKIERELGADSAPRSPLKRVLIPLNRSLQRHAAKPEFFKYPRAVMGVDTEPAPQPGASGMFLKDRLFLGYQEKANIIEVISYNEAAGRFEFQVVRDYRPGGSPKVLYANRAVCTVCHQNQSPIFARPLWDETNANPAIASLLRAQRRDFYQFPVHQGVDVPNALDDATDRANEFSTSQLLWQDGCERAGARRESIACRADTLRFLLQYRLTGSRDFDTRSSRYAERFAPRFLRGWKAQWPQGLLIPNPDIVNRNPLDFFRFSGAQGRDRVYKTSAEDGREQVTFRSRFEPSVPRGPIATWSASQGVESVNRLIAGLSQFIAEADVRRLDASLFQRASGVGPSEHRYEAACRYTPRYRRDAIDRITFRCAAPDQHTEERDGIVEMDGVIYLDAGTVKNGAIDSLAFREGDHLIDLDIIRGKMRGSGLRVEGRLEAAQKHSGLHARRADGNAISEIAFRVDGLPITGMKNRRSADYPGSVVVVVLDDFSPVHDAIDAMSHETLAEASDAFARKPFRRAVVMEGLFEHLAMPRLKWCCLDDDGMPAAVADTAANASEAGVGMANGGPDALPALKPFRRYCAKCHQGEDSFPPNFLHGSPQEVQAQVNHCAQRIFFRLEMWRLRASVRPETPMPPVNALRRLEIAPEQWASHADLAALKNYAAGVLKIGGALPRLEDLITQGYDNLRECLPAPEASAQMVSEVMTEQPPSRNRLAKRESKSQDDGASQQ
ncbi:MAG: hypothetical protein ACREJU_04220 [Nitrospiraceae bacterium]